MKCRFCKYTAIAKFKMSKGCFCYPGDREQNLCGQHIIRATPIGTMKLIKIYNKKELEIVCPEIKNSK